ncbi:MAG: hypothetical protein D6791_03855 [Chloroflexi bacterium]|nr:MAG: hypothetical protein D6791_03855 [Chloroflexota bacterium]
MNLLTDPLIPVTTAEGLGFVSLPELLAGLGDDTVYRIEGLQRHQEDAFHVFLCYLAGAILARDGNWNPVRDANFWRDGMRALAGETGDDAWSLVVDDLTRPGFMQPPQEAPCAQFSSWSGMTCCPDALDSTELAKNHDVKASRASNAKPFEWLYALVSANFNAGYSKGGRDGFYFPSIKAQKNRIGRVYVYPSFSDNFSTTWKFITGHLQKWAQERIAEGVFRKEGQVLTWLKAWDQHPLTATELDPFFIETNRMIRLTLETGERISAYYRPTRNAPLAAQAKLQGKLPDPFVPIDTETSQAISSGKARWPVDRLRAIVFQDGVRTALLDEAFRAPEGKRGLYIVCASLARSRTGTEGYIVTRLRVAPRTIRIFQNRTQRDALGQLATRALDASGRMRRQVLFPALSQLLQASGARETRELRKSEEAWVRSWTQRYDFMWSDRYFEWLLSITSPFDAQSELLGWIGHLRNHAVRLLEEAEQDLPRHTGRLWHARVAAGRAFHGALNNNFPDLKEARHEASVG